MSVGIWLMSIGLALVFLAGIPAVVALGLAVSGAGFGLVFTLAQREAIASVSLAYRGLVVLTWVTGVRVAQMIWTSRRIICHRRDRSSLLVPDDSSHSRPRRSDLAPTPSLVGKDGLFVRGTGARLYPSGFLVCR